MLKFETFSCSFFPLFLQFLTFLLGIGYIEKLSKNKIKWVGQNEENNYLEEIKELTEKISDLEAEEQKIGKLIDRVGLPS